MSEAALRRQVERIAAELARTQAEVRTLRRAARRPQLGDSSIDSGALEVRDPQTGATRLRLGYQPDGSVGVISEGGDPPPVPAGPVVEGIPAGLSVAWDATLAGGGDLPSDFDHVNVHVSQVDGFTPSEDTFVGTIARAGGSLPVAPLEVGTTYYVRLVGVTTSGVQGEPSAQASGVPEAVGGVPGPGSITETEIADDAISTPKLQAEAVTALKIAANAIEAGHILAGAVTAAKLESDLVLGTRIIAGSPGGARVELDDTGIRGYTDADELAFVIDDTGDAIFSGDIVGSEISGSRITIGAAPGNVGAIEATSGVVRTRVTASTGQHAQISAATGRAEFTAWADFNTAGGPAGGIIAVPEQVALTLQSEIGDFSKPWTEQNALPGQAKSHWSSGNGSEVVIRALPDYSSIMLTAPPATDPNDAQDAGYIFTQRYADDIAAASIQGPVWSSGSGPERGKRSMLHLEGARPDRPHTRASHSAARHLFQQQYDMHANVRDTADGVVELASTHSISAPRHAPVRTDMAAQPTVASTGDFVDFTAGQMPTVVFKTSWSGRTRVIIQMCGINYRTSASTIALGFRLSGAGTVPASLQRAAMVRSVGANGPATSGRTALQIVDLDLAGNATYTLTPVWRISGSGHAWGEMHSFDLNYQNSITIDPLM